MFKNITPKKLELVNAHQNTKPNLLKILIETSEDLPINFDHYLSWLSSFMNSESEVTLNNSRAEPAFFSKSLTKLLEASADLLSWPQQSQILTDIFKIYFSGFKAPKPGSGKFSHSSQGLSRVLDGDITNSIKRLMTDSTYSVYGVEKKEDYIRKFKKTFKESNQSLNDLHYKLSYFLNSLPESKVSFTQKPLAKVHQQIFQGLTVVVPESNIELKECGMEMNICVGNGNYVDRIQKGKSFVVLLKDKDTYKYCIELNPKLGIYQYVANSNKRVSASEEKEFINFLQVNKVKNSPWGEFKYVLSEMFS